MTGLLYSNASWKILYVIEDNPRYFFYKEVTVRSYGSLNLQFVINLKE